MGQPLQVKNYTIIHGGRAFSSENRQLSGLQGCVPDSRVWIRPIFTSCSYQESSLCVPWDTRRDQWHWEGFTKPAWPAWATCSWKGRALKPPTTQQSPPPQPFREARPYDGRNPQQLPQQEGWLAAQTSGPELIPGKGVRLSPRRLKDRNSRTKGMHEPLQR